MEVLSAIAINLATGIAIEFWSGINGSVEKEIKKAFNQALTDWSKNKDLREQKRRDLLKFLLDSLKKEEIIIQKSSTKEYVEFLEKFKLRLAEHKAAFGYLESIKNERQFEKEIGHLKKIDNITTDTNKKVSLILEILGDSQKPGSEKELENITHNDSRLVLFNNYKKECEEFYIPRDVDKRFCKLIKLGNVWIYGKSGIGKTALISRNLLINGYETIFCDFSPVSIKSAEDLLKEVSENICEKYSIQDECKEENKIKKLRNNILKIDNSNIVIVIDELSIESPEILKDITLNIIQLITYYNNSRENSSLKFVVSTISKPEIVKALKGKAMEHFQFKEIDQWNGELKDLLIIINDALNDFLDPEMQEIIIDKSNNSPRLLKAIIRKLLVQDNINMKVVTKVSDETYNEHF